MTRTRRGISARMRWDECRPSLARCARVPRPLRPPVERIRNRIGGLCSRGTPARPPVPAVREARFVFVDVHFWAPLRSRISDSQSLGDVGVGVVFPSFVHRCLLSGAVLRVSSGRSRLATLSRFTKHVTQTVKHKPSECSVGPRAMEPNMDAGIAPYGTRDHTRRRLHISADLEHRRRVHTRQ